MDDATRVSHHPLLDVGRTPRMYFDTLLERASKRWHVAYFRHTRVGVKGYNVPLGSDSPLFRPAPGPEIEVSCRDLLLGFDGLKDQFTLVDRPIDCSPHAELMRVVGKGHAPDATEYLARTHTGTLDRRRPRRISTTDLRELGRRYQQARDAFRSGISEPVKIARLRERLYIVDGKHRAALAATLTGSVRCVDASHVFRDSYYSWVRGMMDERPTEYSRQRRFVSDALMSEAVRAV